MDRFMLLRLGSILQLMLILLKFLYIPIDKPLYTWYNRCVDIRCVRILLNWRVDMLYQSCLNSYINYVDIYIVHVWVYKFIGKHGQ